MQIPWAGADVRLRVNRRAVQATPQAAETRLFFNTAGYPVDLPIGGPFDADHWQSLGFRLAQPGDCLGEPFYSVYDDQFAGRRCFIVGGGPSLRGFDFSSLDHDIVIAVNRACEHVHADIAFTADRYFFEQLTRGNLGEGCLEGWGAAPWRVALAHDFIYPHDVHPVFVRAEGEPFDLDMRRGIYFGKNSGFAALHLAACMGCTPICLLGFDMHGEGGQQAWFHDGYDLRLRSVVYRAHRKAFYWHAPEFKEHGVEVLNLSPHSALKCFDYAEFEDGQLRKTKVFVNKEGFRVRLPLEHHLTAGRGIGHWREKGFVPADEYVPEAGLYADMDVRAVLPGGIWQGRRCFVVGGGPSLVDFDFSQLDGELVIAVNRAFEHCNADVIYTADPRFVQWLVRGDLGEEAYAKFQGSAGIKVALDRGYVYPPDMYLAPYGEGFGRSFDDGIGFGGNSGLSALNFAIALGANPIYLLGFDGKGGKGRQKWFHAGYPKDNGTLAYDVWGERFEQAAAKCKEWGVQVYNLSTRSRLTCFDAGTMPKKTSVPIVVTHYTDEYADELKTLAASCEKFGLDLEATHIESMGSWRRNSNYVCQHIRDMLRKHNRPVLRVDADAEFKGYPKLFEQGFDADFAAHVRDGRELLGGTLYFAPTPATFRVLDAWIGLCDQYPGRSNQALLHDIVRKDRYGAKFVELPSEYCKIFDSMPGNAVIEHHQASRRLKEQIGY